MDGTTQFFGIIIHKSRHPEIKTGVFRNFPKQLFPGTASSINQNQLLISSRAPVTWDAQIDMAIDFDGQPIDIGFNPQFFIDVLRVIKADEFVLELGDSDRPGVIKSGDFLYIVMPVNL